MKQAFKFISSASLALLLPMVTFAGGFADGDGGDTNPLGNFVNAVTTFVADVLVPLVLGLAFLAFVWGVFKFFIAGGADEEKRNEGKQLMIYSILGFVLIVALYGIVNFVVDTLGTGTATTLEVPQIPTVAE